MGLEARAPAHCKQQGRARPCQPRTCWGQAQLGRAAALWCARPARQTCRAAPPSAAAAARSCLCHRGHTPAGSGLPAHRCMRRTCEPEPHQHSSDSTQGNERRQQQLQAAALLTTTGSGRGGSSGGVRAAAASCTAICSSAAGCPGAVSSSWKAPQEAASSQAALAAALAALTCTSGALAATICSVWQQGNQQGSTARLGPR
jgi:hypothetical protein